MSRKSKKKKSSAYVSINSSKFRKMMGLGNRSRDKRRMRRMSKSNAGWHKKGGKTFYKVNPTYYDLFILELNEKSFSYYEFVPGYQSCPTYKNGSWDGKALYVTFKENTDALSFKYKIWGKKYA